MIAKSSAAGYFQTLFKYTYNDESLHYIKGSVEGQTKNYYQICLKK